MLSGRVVAGDLLRRACERHIRDIKDAPRRGFHWRPEVAADALDFFPKVLTITAGAQVGQPFRLPSWTAFAVGSLYGWRRASGLKRFRHAWFELGKGQVKTPLMAAIGLYEMGFAGTQRAEVYAIAKDRNQANVLFRDAVAMCRVPMPDDPESLEQCGEVKIRGVGDNAWKIEHPKTGSMFRPLAGDEVVSGPRPAAVLADEIHEWRSGQPIETWQEAIVKAPGSPLMLLGTNTPAADQIVGTEYSEAYQRILRGEVADDTAFAIIARVDKDDKPFEDETCWAKALPCLGITYPVENVRDRVRAARPRLAAAESVKRLFFGIPVGTSEYWIDLDAWENVQGKVTLADLRGRRVYLSLDLALKNDLVALGIGALDDDGRLLATVRYWKPAQGIEDAERGDAAPYRQWVGEGLISAVPGLAIEYEFVAAAVRDLCNELSVELMAFDPAHITEFRKACDRISFSTWIWDPEQPAGSGLKMVIHGQGRQGMHSKKALWMPRSLQQFEDRILTGRIVIDKSPVTSWCAANAAVQADAQDNRFLVKKRSRGRIDGMTAGAMLCGAVEMVTGDAHGLIPSDFELKVF